MNKRIIGGYFSILFALAALPTLCAAESNAIAKTIKADVAELIAGINAHDAAKATAFDAVDVISMECGRPSSIGIEADKEGLKMGFTHQPYWKVSLIDESVDVARDGDLAVYRGIYNEDNRRGDVQLTHKVNFIAEFKRQTDRSWKIAWYIVSEMERSHPKQM
jgi:ketosteroid isomerase-like protein